MCSKSWLSFPKTDEFKKPENCLSNPFFYSEKRRGFHLDQRYGPRAKSRSFIDRAAGIQQQYFGCPDHSLATCLCTRKHSICPSFECFVCFARGFRSKMSSRVTPFSEGFIAELDDTPRLLGCT